MIWPFGVGAVELLLLFALAFASSFGVPGAMVLMLSSGAFSGSLLDLVPMIFFSVLGAVGGDLASYELARKFSVPVSKRFPSLIPSNENRNKVFEKYKNIGFSMVFFTRFLAVLFGAPVNYLAGLARFSRKVFILACVAGEAIYGSMYLVLGYLFKETWNDLAGVINDVGTVIILAAVAAGIAYALWRRARKPAPAPIKTRELI